MKVKTERWPDDFRNLKSGVNDIYNSYQKANPGRNVSAEEWRMERAQLHAKYAEWKGITKAISSTTRHTRKSHPYKPPDDMSLSDKKLINASGDSPVLSILKKIFLNFPLEERQIELWKGRERVATAMITSDDARPIEDEKTKESFPTPRQWAMRIFCVKRISVRSHIKVQGQSIESWCKIIGSRQCPAGPSQPLCRFPDFDEICNKFR